MKKIIFQKNLMCLFKFRISLSLNFNQNLTTGSYTTLNFESQFQGQEKIEKNFWGHFHEAQTIIIIVYG